MSITWSLESLVDITCVKLNYTKMDSSELCMEKEIGEPFKIKMVESIRMTTREERLQELKRVKYNVFGLDADMIAVDLLTDSGVGAMSNAQWAGLMVGDESYAGSKSFQRLEATVRRITGVQYVIPAHQGRGAENVLFNALLEGRQETTVVCNGVFLTSENIMNSLGCRAVNITVPKGDKIKFAGNMDCDKLKEELSRPKNNVSFALLVVTNNVVSGQPVSMRNVEDVARICRQYGIPLVVDACRFVENAWYIKTLEEGYGDKSLKEICLEMFSHVDAIIVSAKKNGLSNIGGFLCVRSEDIYMRARRKCLVYEGHYTYGGMSGRDMEAIAIGLDECMTDTYMQYRFDSLKMLAECLNEVGVPVAAFASTSVYVNARKIIPHIPIEKQPSLSLACSLYIEGGIRVLGTVTKAAQVDDMIKLAVPHRLYTVSHFKYVAKVFQRVLHSASRIHGLNVTYSPDFPQTFFEVEMKPVDEPNNSLDQ